MTSMRQSMFPVVGLRASPKRAARHVETAGNGAGLYDYSGDHNSVSVLVCGEGKPENAAKVLDGLQPFGKRVWNAHRVDVIHKATPSLDSGDCIELWLQSTGRGVQLVTYQFSPLDSAKLSLRDVNATARACPAAGQVEARL